MNTKQIGNITELKVILAFLELGYNVLLPYGDNERYDFVSDVKGDFLRIQVKSAITRDNGATFCFSCRSCNRKDGKIVHHLYSNEEIDYFATIFNEKCYLIPVAECGSNKILRIAPTKSAQNKKIFWAKDYELEKMLNKIKTF